MYLTMSFSKKSTHCCLLVVGLLVHQAFSFSVEELCNKRCLYGRGGVLCNCNARHFTGKRSSLIEDENVYITGFNTHERHSKFPQVNIRNGKPVNIVASVPLPGNGIHPEIFNLREASHLDNSWHSQRFENILSSLNQKARLNTDSMAGVRGDEKDDTDGNVHRELDSALPIIYIEQNTNRDKNEDDYEKRAKEEVASKLKQIMAGPILTDVQHDVANNLREDEDVDIDEDTTPNEETQRHQLIQLQRVLKRALHGR